jgi:hypothetical protein
MDMICPLSIGNYGPPRPPGTYACAGSRTRTRRRGGTRFPRIRLLLSFVIMHGMSTARVVNFMYLNFIARLRARIRYRSYYTARHVRDGRCGQRRKLRLRRLRLLFCTRAVIGRTTLAHAILLHTRLRQERVVIDEIEGRKRRSQ